MTGGDKEAVLNDALEAAAHCCQGFSTSDCESAVQASRKVIRSYARYQSSSGVHS